MSYHRIKAQIDDLSRIITRATSKDRQRRAAHVLKEQLEARLSEMRQEFGVPPESQSTADVAASTFDRDREP